MVLVVIIWGPAVGFEGGADGVAWQIGVDEEDGDGFKERVILEVGIGQLRQVVDGDIQGGGDLVEDVDCGAAETGFDGGEEGRGQFGFRGDVADFFVLRDTVHVDGGTVEQAS